MICYYISEMTNSEAGQVQSSETLGIVPQHYTDAAVGYLHAPVDALSWMTGDDETDAVEPKRPWRPQKAKLDLNAWSIMA